MMMRRLALFVVALAGLPVLTQTALLATELSYKPRNARGVYPFVSYLGGVGQILGLALKAFHRSPLA